MKPRNLLAVKVVQLEQLRNELHNLFESLSEAQAAPVGAGYWSPFIDLCDAADAVTVRAELPGVGAEQVSVAYSDGVLKISGEKREAEPPRKPVCYLCLERGYGAFSRAVRLPWPVDIRRATARLKDGVLTVRLPKLVERRQGEIRIKVTEE